MIVSGKVSYEYIACQQARQGVMILSEFAGAAQSLNGSIVVNPWDSQQVADAIHEAVTMPASTRAENHRKLFKYVNKYSAAFWGRSFIREMARLVDPADPAAHTESRATRKGADDVNIIGDGMVTVSSMVSAVA
jgi:trehalose 6-phosphate synthase